MVINDQGSSADGVYTLAKNFLSRADFAGISFANLQSLAFNASAAMEIDVTGTPAGTAVTVYGNSVTDGKAFRTGGAVGLDAILGPLTLVGQDPLFNDFLFDDSATASAHTYTMTGSTIQRDGAALMTYRDSANAASDVVALFAGNHGNTLNIASTNGRFQTDVEDGKGQNQDNILSTGAGAPAFLLSIAGSDLVRVGSQSTSLTDTAAHGGTLAHILSPVYVLQTAQSAPTLVLDNSSDSSPHPAASPVVVRYDSNDAEIGGGIMELDSLAPAPIKWDPQNNTAINVLLHSGNGNDAFVIQGLSQFAPLTIDMGTGANAVTLDNVDLGSADAANADHHVTLLGRGNANTFTFDDSRSPANHTYTTQGFQITRTNFPVTVDLDSSFQGTGAPQNQANSIVNGSFENPVVPVGSYTDFAGGATTLPGWTVVGDDVMINRGDIRAVRRHFQFCGWKTMARPHRRTSNSPKPTA